MKPTRAHYVLILSIIIASTCIAKAQTAIANQAQDEKIGLNYAFIHFDKRFDDPWHLATFSYGKQHKWGYGGLNLNYANRFRQTGTELELETYPKFKKGLYAYVGAAAKLSDKSLFPNYRLGVSIYKSLPNKFEIEGGIRHLAFDQIANVWVLGLGKYSGNAFFNIRSYWKANESSWGKSFILSGRFYLSDDRYDYWGLNIGTGVSPDDRTQITNTIDQLKSIRAGADFSKNLNKKTIIRLGAQWINEEYQNDVYGNQFGINIGINRKL